MLDKLVDLIVEWLKLLFFAFTLTEYQRGVVLRLGKFNREVGPGFHWKWPFDVDVVLFDAMFPRVKFMGPQSLITKDGISVVISYLVTYEISDVKKSILNTAGPVAALEYASFGVVADFVNKHTWAELRSVKAVDDEKELDLDNEVAKKVRRRAAKYGVHVIDIGFHDLTSSKALRLMNSMDREELI